MARASDRTFAELRSPRPPSGPAGQEGKTYVPPFDPKDMALRGRIGAYRLHALRDPRDTTAEARRIFTSSFEQLVDPHRQLPVAERRRRAEAARKAHYTRLARLSALARRAKRRNSP
jgi:hypothetical protein